MNKFRVDRANKLSVPCGMTSIKYIGDSLMEAGKVYNSTYLGYDAWGKPNAEYGVILSEWDGTEYVVKLSKGVA